MIKINDTYISGIAALNIPCPEDTWGLREFFFLNSEEDLKNDLAGSGESCFVNTNDIFQNEGLYECSAIFLELGHDLSKEGETFCANHYRAFCDLLVSHILDGVDSYLDPDDYFTTEAHLTILDSWVERCEIHLGEKYQPSFDQWRQTIQNGL